MLVGVSWLEDWEFCPYKFYRYYQRVTTGAVNIKSPEQLDGIRAHAMIDEDAVPCDMSEDEIIVSGVLAGESLPEIRGFSVSNERMIGRIDGLVLSDGFIRVIEDKPFKKSRTVFPSHKLQAKGYAALLVSVYSVCRGRPIFVVIRDENTQEELWSSLFTAADDAEVWSAVSNIESIIAGTKKAVPVRNARPDKCRGCTDRACIWHL